MDHPIHRKVGFESSRCDAAFILASRSRIEALFGVAPDHFDDTTERLLIIAPPAVPLRVVWAAARSGIARHGNRVTLPLVYGRNPPARSWRRKSGRLPVCHLLLAAERT